MRSIVVSNGGLVGPLRGPPRARLPTGAGPARSARGLPPLAPNPAGSAGREYPPRTPRPRLRRGSGGSPPASTRGGHPLRPRSSGGSRGSPGRPPLPGVPPARLPGVAVRSSYTQLAAVERRPSASSKPMRGEQPGRPSAEGGAPLPPLPLPSLPRYPLSPHPSGIQSGVPHGLFWGKEGRGGVLAVVRSGAGRAKIPAGAGRTGGRGELRGP